VREEVQRKYCISQVKRMTRGWSGNETRLPSLSDGLGTRLYYDVFHFKHTGLVAVQQYQHPKTLNEMAQQLVGIVIGTRMMKTAKVEVTRMVLHPHVIKVRPDS